MRTLDYWKKKLGMNKGGEKKEELRSAEAIIVAYQNPKVAKKQVILAKRIKQLNENTSVYKTIKQDKDGTMVGVMHDRIYDDRETFFSVVKDFLDNDWIFEQGDPVAVRLLREQGIINA